MKPANNGRRIMVLGDMRELGDTSPVLHAALAADTAEENHIDRVYCCGENDGPSVRLPAADNLRGQLHQRQRCPRHPPSPPPKSARATS